MHRYLSLEQQQDYFEEMKSQFKGSPYQDVNQTKIRKINGKLSYRCNCPRCNNHCGQFFVSRDHQTYILSCMDNSICSFRMNLHNLIRSYGNDEIKSKWDTSIKNHNDYRFPIKNAGRPKGSKTKKRNLTPIEGLTDELGRLRIKGML